MLLHFIDFYFSIIDSVCRFELFDADGLYVIQGSSTSSLEALWNLAAKSLVELRYLFAIATERSAKHHLQNAMYA